MYQETVTVFNQYEDQSGKIYWYPHVITNVDLIIDKAANVEKTGLETADNAKLHIRYTVSNDTMYVDGTKYLPPREWSDQTNDCLSESLTFATGDFFIRGEYGTDVVADSDYETRVDGGFYDYLNKRRDAVFLITDVSGAYSLIPHFEIGGK